MSTYLMTRSRWHPDLLVVLTGVLLLPVLAAGAQPLTVSAHISLSDGLAHPSVSALLRDQQGFIWIGTIDGLSRYDPRTARFTTYRHDPANPCTYPITM